MRGLGVFFVSVALLAGCERAEEDEDLCARAVDHMLEVMQSAGELSAEERKTMQVVKNLSESRCRSEGLSQEHADCVFRVESPQEMLKISDCPAIAEDKPSWIITRGRAGSLGERSTPDSRGEPGLHGSE